MADVLILVVASFFGAVGFLAEHWLIVLPVVTVAWLLLFVPPRTWRRQRHAGAQLENAHTPRAQQVPALQSRAREPQLTH